MVPSFLVIFFVRHHLVDSEASREGYDRQNQGKLVIESFLG